MPWVGGSRPGRRWPTARPPGVRAREPIFSEAHTDGFCGIEKSTPQPAGSCAPLRPGRWVYEKREGRAKAGAGSRSTECGGIPATRPRSAALWFSARGRRGTFVWLRAREPIFSETHTNEFCGIGKSTPQPAGSCAPLRPGRWVYEKGKPKAPVGGLSRQTRHLSTAAFAGRCWSHFIHRRLRVVPYGLPGYRRLRRAPPQHRCCPGARASGSHGIWEDSAGAREYPICAEGWALWVHGGSPNLLEATGGTYRLGTPQG